MKPNLYCYAYPTDWSRSPHEITLCLHPSDKARLDAIPRGESDILRGIIAQDLISKKWFAVRHHPCWCDTFNCCCAAQAHEVSGPRARFKWTPIELLTEDDREEY